MQYLENRSTQLFIIPEENLDWHPGVIDNLKSGLDAIQSFHLILTELPAI